jgi:DNA (cytosine-5)-methyltransferase 1
VSEHPRLLDLYCGAGGAARGYQRAGFHVVGVDIAPQPRYAGDEFIRADALAYVAAHGREFDAIHASPPCQAHTTLRARHKGTEYADLIPATRSALTDAARPWIIENVVGAPLREPVLLCGTMFGLKVYRHRLFECSWFFLAPPHAPHRDAMPKQSGRVSPRGYVTVCGGGHGPDNWFAPVAMGIGWMTRAELTQAIPPAYSEFVGHQLLRALRVPA